MPRISVPVQTEVTWRDEAAVRARKSTIASSRMASFVPAPPGTMRTSRLPSKSANEVVGRSETPVSDGTGSSVFQNRCVLPLAPRIAWGPATSSRVKPGYSTIPVVIGSGFRMRLGWLRAPPILEAVLPFSAPAA